MSVPAGVPSSFLNSALLSLIRPQMHFDIQKWDFVYTNGLVSVQTLQPQNEVVGDLPSIGIPDIRLGVYPQGYNSKNPVGD